MPEQLLLKIITGPRAGYSLHLTDKKEILIGRKKGHIILEDPLISSQHARLFVQKTHGTYKI